MNIDLNLFCLKERVVKKDKRRPKSENNFENKDVIEIAVTYVKSSTELYGIGNRLLNDIRKLEDEMNVWYSENRQTIEFPFVPEIETICAALVENRWSRARIIHHGNGGCGAFLIDFGEIVKLKLSSLRWLEDRFIRMPPAASRFLFSNSCSLEQLFQSSCDQNTVIDSSQDLSKQKKLSVKIVHSFGSFPTNYECSLVVEIPNNRELYENNVPEAINVGSVNTFKSIFNKDGNLADHQSPKRIVKMSHCISPDVFYLQFENDREKLIRLQNELQALDEIALCQPKDSWVLGKRCYVRTKMPTTLRERWYRGEICGISDAHWEVFLRDYGNVVCIAMSENLVSEMDKFETMKNAAIKCSLAFITTTIGSEWSLEAIDKFQNLYRSYEQLALSFIPLKQPQKQEEQSTFVQPVILWGLKYVNVSALMPPICEYTNINKEMVQHGLAQSTQNMSVFEMNLNKSILPDAVSPKLISWIPPKPIAQSSFTCVPTRVSDELVVYFHDKDEEKELNSMRKTAMEKFRDYKGNELQWNPNEPCMAKYIDGTFYRAKILSIVDINTAKVIRPSDIFIIVNSQSD